jgi:hypothetical protein
MTLKNNVCKNCGHFIAVNRISQKCFHLVKNQGTQWISITCYRKNCGCEKPILVKSYD